MWPRELAPAEHQQTLTRMHGEAVGTAAGAGGRDTPASPGVLQRVWASSWPHVTAAELRTQSRGRGRSAGRCGVVCTCGVCREALLFPRSCFRHCPSVSSPLPVKL